MDKIDEQETELKECRDLKVRVAKLEAELSRYRDEENGDTTSTTGENDTGSEPM